MAVPIRRALARPALFGALIATLALSAGAPAAARQLPGESDSQAVIRIAKNQLGEPWVWAQAGPNSFDCIGLVYFAFKRAGITEAIGGRRGVQSYWDYFARRGRASRTNGQRGDLVIWGRGKHMGIYLGHGRAISTLTDGVRIHGINQLTDPFTTFLHVRMDR